MKKNAARQAKPRPRSTGTPSASKPRTPILTLVLLSLAVAGATLMAHWPVLDAQALNMDDQRYLFENPVLQNPSVSSAVTVVSEVFQSSTVRGYYEPLTLISLMLDVAAGGRMDDLKPFHVTSLSLHVLNTVLLIVLLYVLFGRPWIAAGVGLIFGVHPLTVEPVAWVWERKTLLSAFFALWCIILYVRYTRRPSIALYTAVSAMFVLALMAKPTVTPLPVLLLLLDFWPLNRLSTRAVWEKLPLLMIAGVSSIITVVSTARTGSATLLGDYSLLQVPLKICYLIIFYIAKLVVPVRLSSIYVLPPMTLSQPTVLVAVMGICALIGLLAFSYRRTRAPIMAAAFFVIAMSPTLGVVQYSWVAASDKYIYIPAIGLMIALAALLQRLVGDSGTPRSARPVAVGVLAMAVLLGAGTRVYLREWESTLRLTRYMLALAPDSPYAHFSYGNVLNQEQDYENALVHLSRTIELKPNYAYAYNNRASVYARLGEYDLAIADCTQAIRINPDYVEAYSNRGFVYGEKGDHAQAIKDYTKALELNPRESKAYANLSNVYAAANDFEQAIRECDKAIRLQPSNADAYYNRGNAYNQKGDRDRAFQDYSKAIEYQPDFAKAYNNRGNLYSTRGQYDLAVSDFSKAIEIDPRFTEAYFNRAMAYSVKGDFVRAIADYTKAIEIKPEDADTFFNRGSAYQNQGDNPRAIQDYDHALAIKPDHLEALNSRATAYGALGQFDHVIQDCSKAIALKPDYAIAYSNRGNAFAAQNEHARAIEDYTRSIQLQPEVAATYHNRALSNYFLKQYDQSWADVNKCKELGESPIPDLLQKLKEATGHTE